MKKMPVELAEKIKNCFPDWKELHSAVDTNHEIVGRYLDDASESSISVTLILQLIHANKIDELKNRCLMLNTKKQLYVDWLTWYRSNHVLRQG